MRNTIFNRCLIMFCVVIFVMILAGFITHTEANDQCNCVEWLRNNKVPTLPHNLCTLQDKKNIIKHSVKPKKGVVAIIDPPFYLKSDEKCGARLIRKGESIGHVAYVIGVKKKKGPDIIKIIEANYKTCKVTEREGTESELKILGYWKP